ncbi:MAG: class I SAM-dependent methyltransferase [Bacillota bacterium]
MESQSGRSLPVVYQPFDAGRRGHWHDRGAILDFREAVGGGDLLDFGPGDGWPSLLVAPLARSVTGVDGSLRRVQVCRQNADRLGITNFRAAHCRAGEPLPFPDNSFDGAMAASSLEQTPDPAAALRELYRVLRPGGRLRIRYESLEGYRGQERELFARAVNEAMTQLVLIDRRVDEERALYVVLRLAAPLPAVAERLGVTEQRPLQFSDLSLAGLEGLRPWLVEAGSFQLIHPACRTWLALLREAGFRSATPTHGGGGFAHRLFEALPPAERPADLAGVDRLLRPLIAVVVGMEAPAHLSPPITAVK